MIAAGITIAVLGLGTIAAVGGTAVWWKRRKALLAALRWPRPAVQLENLKDGDADPSPSGFTLKFLSQNAFAHFFVPAPHRKQRLRGLAEAILAQSYDFVAVQELFTVSVGLLKFRGLERGFRRLMEEAGLRHATTTALSRKAFGQNSGLVLYSRHPIIKERFYPFETTGEILNRKGMHVAYLNVRGVVVIVINTHFDSRSPVVKAAQARQLAALVKKLREQPVSNVAFTRAVSNPVALPTPSGPGNVIPIIVLGDFNMCPMTWCHDIYNWLAQSLTPLTDVLLQPTRDGDIIATHQEGSVIDHVFVGNAASRGPSVVPSAISIRNFRDCDGRYVSDHCGVEVSLTLATNSEAK